MQPVAVEMLATIGPNPGFDDLNLSTLCQDMYNLAFLQAPTDTVRLFTNNVTPTKGGGVAQFTELTIAEAPNYAPQTVPAGSVQGRDADTNWETVANAVTTFQGNSTPPPTPINVFGVFVTNSTGTTLRSYMLFAAPISLNSTFWIVNMLFSAKTAQTP